MGPPHRPGHGLPLPRGTLVQVENAFENLLGPGEKPLLGVVLSFMGFDVVAWTGAREYSILLSDGRVLLFSDRLWDVSPLSAFSSHDPLAD